MKIDIDAYNYEDAWMYASDYQEKNNSSNKFRGNNGCPLCNEDEDCPGIHELIDYINMTDEQLAERGLFKKEQINKLTEEISKLNNKIYWFERLFAKYPKRNFSRLRKNRNKQRKQI